MSIRRLGVGTAALLVLVVLAGCAGLLGGGDRQPTETVTPAPVPETTASPTPDRSPTVSATQTSSDTGSETVADYSSLEPTCTRPPGLVVHIQVVALATNDPQTNDGIRTTWRFAAPSNKRYTGPYSNFERLIETRFQPLLDAETVTYGSLGGANRSTQRRVTVTASDGTSNTYIWRLEKQSTGQYDGCWMTTAVQEVEPSGEGTETES